MIRAFNRRMFAVANKSELPNTAHPVIAKRGSFKADLVQGETYFWCTCGASKNQPWCDGSHKGTDFQPLKFEWTEADKKNVSLCGCKLNKDSAGALCDRSHRFIDFDKLAEEKPGFQREPEFMKAMEDHLKSKGEWRF